MPPTSVLPDWLERALSLLKAGDVDGFAAMYAPDAIHEFPFAPEAAPRALAGRDAIAAYMRKLPSLIRFGAFLDVRVRQIGDETIVEATGHHRRVEDDAECELGYVWFITRRDGKVAHFRDYMNPLQLSKTVSG